MLPPPLLKYCRCARKPCILFLDIYLLSSATRAYNIQVVYDLLDPNNRKKKGAGLEIREHGVLGIYVKGLQVLYCCIYVLIHE